MIAQLITPSGGLVAEVECAPGAPRILYGERLFTLIGNSYVEFFPTPQTVAVQTPGFLGLRSEDPSFPVVPVLPTSGF